MVTRKDIAEKAKVSVSVVSRALNNSGYVKEEKKQEIIRIAKELGYYTNPVALSLATKRTKQLLFFCKEIENAFSIMLYEGMLQAARKQGYTVVIQGDVDFENIKNLMVDGIIFPNEFTAEIYLKSGGKNYYLPAVSATYGNPISFKKSIPIIESDTRNAMEMALHYLMKRGHKKIALAMPYAFDSTENRIYAWKEFMSYEINDINSYYLGICKKELKNDSRVMDFPEERYIGDMSVLESFFEKGVLAAEIFKERKLDATAIVSFNDEMALGVCKGLKKAGYKVPDDVSVMGIDGIFSRKYSEVELTSVSLNPKKQGEKCVEVLLDILINKKAKYVTHIPHKIIEGESVKTIIR